MKGWGHTVVSVILYLFLLRVWNEEFLTSYSLPLFIVITVCGGLFPDVDLIIMRKIKGFKHRNALTHSAIFPWIFSILIFTSPQIPKDLIPYLSQVIFAFSAGVSSHLFADLVSGKAWIKGLKGGRGRYWLIMNGLASLPFSTLYIGQSTAFIIITS